MVDLAWLGYVGATTGVIGAVTGVSGSVMGFIAYRHAKQIKALDLRVAVRAADARIRAALDALPQQLNQANRSRRAVLAAIGLGMSSALERWDRELQEDQKALAVLATARPPEDAYATASLEQLEAALVRATEQLLCIEVLQGKYRRATDDDDRKRDQIRADMRARP